MRSFPHLSGRAGNPKLTLFIRRRTNECAVQDYGVGGRVQAGVVFENTSDVEPLVVLRYFGPEVNPDAPEMGAYRKKRF